MKLLHKFHYVGGIFWPVGLLRHGGTCEFASPSCLFSCCAFNHGTENERISYDQKREIFKQITTDNLESVTRRILQDLDDLGVNIISWLASGDCPTKHTERVVLIITELADHGVHQAVVTRSSILYHDLWSRRHKHKGMIGTALTVETMNEIPMEDGLFAVPNYRCGHEEFWRVSITTGYNGNPRFDTMTYVESEYDLRKCLIDRKDVFYP